MIFLDTNVVIGIINQPSDRVRRRYAEALAHGDVIALSTIAIYELCYGVAKSKSKRLNAAVLDAFLSGAVVTVPYEATDAAVAGEVRATLEAAGTPIGHYDLLIAAHALCRGATLVTANMREFARVPGLKVEDWTV